MKGVFERAGVEVTSGKKKEIDRTIHAMVGVEYKDCSATWREVKKRLAEDEADFITRLKEAL
jgi:D-Tyr-tRNAtyr deacylase